MATSTDGIFSSFLNSMRVFGSWVWAAPQKVVEGFSWFSSKKRDVPDTEQGRALHKALEPTSSLDKLAQTWAYASFWTKGAVLAGTTLFFGLLGLAFGASVLLSLTSLAIGLGVHAVFVAHHEARVRRITGLVTAQEALKEEVADALESIQEEVVDFIQAQKKETQETVTQLKQDAQVLTKAVTVIDEQVGAIALVNQQLEDVGQHIETTLNQVDGHALSWGKGLEHHQDVVGTLIDSTQQLSTVVDDLAITHKALDTQVGALHDAVVELTKPLEESSNESDSLLIDLSLYTEQTHQLGEQLTAFDARCEQRKDMRINETELLVDESILGAHREAIGATDEALNQMALRREERLVQRAAHEEAAKKLLGELPVLLAHQQEHRECVVLPFDAPNPKSEWLESVNQSIAARQVRMDALKEPGLAPHQERSQDHSVFVRSIEDDLKSRSEQRKARRARLEASCRFFGGSAQGTGTDEILMPSISIH